MTAQMPPRVLGEAQRRAEEQVSRLHLPLQFLTELLEHQAPVSFPKDALIFRRGSTADVTYWIVSGLVKVYCPVSDGGAVIMRVAGPGDLIGFIDDIGSAGRRVQALQAQAMTKTVLGIFTRNHVLTLLKTLNADSLISLLENLNTAWSATLSWWIGFLGLSFRERLQSTLQDLAARFGAPESRGILLTLELSHGELAEMIASSRPMVTRLLAEFVNQGFLARQGKQYILLNKVTDTVAGIVEVRHPISAPPR
jgi:CRP/FNR family cyclic AMP-dependent transcriptional regulator